MTNSASKKMTVEQLYQALGAIVAAGRGGESVLIPYDPGFATLGGQPAVEIEQVSNGFDWDNGKHFLVPSKRLGTPDAELRGRLKKIENRLGHLHLAAKGSMGGDETARLARVSEILVLISNDLAGRS